MSWTEREEMKSQRSTDSILGGDINSVILLMKSAAARDHVLPARLPRLLIYG